MNTNEHHEGWDEQVLPFQLDAANIRGRIARLDTLLDNVLRQHDYPSQVSALVAEAVMLTALIGQTIKLRWKLSLQIRGDGPIRIIATDYYGPSEDGEPAKIRAYASYDTERLNETEVSGFDNIGKGMFAILMDQGEHMKPYQGITPLSQGSLSKCAETYFAQSEQLPTRFQVIVGESSAPGEKKSWRAGGVMLQHMPKASPLMAKDLPSSPDGLLSADDLLSGDEGADDWKFSDGTDLTGNVVLPNGKSANSDDEQEPISDEIYYIVADKCTECVGFHEEPQCAAVCPVDCCVPDENNVETQEELLGKQKFMHQE